jgi:hypothetical protein
VALAIAKRTGLMYESRGGSYLPLVPTPTLSHARLIDHHGGQSDIPLLARFEGQCGLVFREDQFDPVTRTRRGRLYEGGHYVQPSTEYALPHPHEVQHAAPITVAGDRVDLYIYIPSPSLLSNPRSLGGKLLGLGTSAFETQWRILDVEMVGYGDLLVTLKSLSVFGILPELDPGAMPSEARVPVNDAVDRVVSAAFRETPISVIDHCRSALVTIISRWIYDQGRNEAVLEKDLGDLCTLLEQKDLKMIARSAWVVARLHNKGKPNAVFEHKLKPAADEDAQFCIHVVGLTLREFGWTTTAIRA